PPTLTLVRRIVSSASPLNFPCFFASTIVPVILAPFGTATSPFATIGAARLPSNSSPALFLYELIDVARITGNVVPAGTTNGAGGSGGGAGACSCAFAGFAA